MQSITELIEHLQAVQNGDAEIPGHPVLQAVNRQLVYRAKAARKAQDRVVQGIDDALDDARLFRWDAITDGLFRSIWPLGASTASAGLC